jgi:dienelactone hydrolase
MLIAALLGLAAAGGGAAEPPPTIPLPSDLALEPAAAGIPPGVARFAGAWTHGAWDGVLPHVLVVERVDAAGQAQVVYGLGDFAEGNVSRGYRRLTGRIGGDALEVDLGGDARATYRLVGDALRGTYTTGRRVSTVALARAPLADLARLPATVPGAVPGTTVRIPMAEPGGRRLTLEATLYRPPGDGPHPVLLFNHGSTGGGAVAPTVTLRPSRLAPFFVARGFAVLAPMRRGRGASEGEHAEWEGSCDAAVLGSGLARAIEDVEATMAFLRAAPWAEPGRVLIGGQSRGGLLSVAYAAERPGRALAVINFAGGWTTSNCDWSGRSFNEPTFASAGGRARVPMLWLYAERDRYYSDEAIQRYHRVFAAAGGVATFHLFPAIGGDGHRLVDRADIWPPAVDDFLKRLNLSSR